MIVFPNAKINVGLRVLRKRPDNYHEIATVMLPVGWCDILEITPAKGISGTFRQTGNGLDCPPEKNIVLKALSALEKYIGRPLPHVDITLEKHIPSGAGMGGGSADAAFTLTALNTMFDLGLSQDELAEVAVKVGADCPFFIYNKPMYCTGIGEKMTPVDASALDGLFLVTAKPEAEAVSTAAAYSGITPQELEENEDIVSGLNLIPEGTCPLVNDFEPTVMGLRPQIRALKEHLTNSGALYASMSGSGAAVYGFFNSRIDAEKAQSELTGCESAVWGPLKF